jgi:hypothetical protein
MTNSSAIQCQVIGGIFTQSLLLLHFTQEAEEERLQQKEQDFRCAVIDVRLTSISF